MSTSTARNAEQTIRLDVVEVQGKLTTVYNPTYNNVVGMPPVGVPSTDDKQTPGLAPRQLETGWCWAAWGNNDRWPTDIRLKIESVPIAGATIDKLVKMLYGNGIAYYRRADLKPGVKNIQRHYSGKLENWIERNRIATEFLPAQFTDLRFTWNTWCEMIFTRDRRAVSNIFTKTAEHCRLSQQDETLARNLFLLYSPDFGYQTPEETRIGRIPLFQWDMEEQFLALLPGHKMAWHSRIPTAGLINYARPFWQGLFRENGWMDASIRVPEVVNAMMKNQIILKYIIRIPITYFKIRHQQWDTYTDEEKTRLIDAKVAEWNTALKGEKNAFTSIASVFQQNEITGDSIGKVEIESVDDKLKKDAWVPSSETADAQIVQGLGMHPSQVGLQPQGGKMGAGSGSDQRETFNIGISTNNIEQLVVLEPLNWIARYNAQFDPEWDVRFFIDHTHHTTTNDQEDGMKPSQTTLQID